MIPSLPFELIKDIIQLILPPVQYTTHIERYSILSACALVSPIWRSIAQEELMKYLVVKNVVGLKLLIERLKVMKSEGSEVEASSIQLEGYHTADVSDVENLLQLCSSVSKLIVVGTFFPTKLFFSFDWSILSNLKSLNLIRCEAPPARTPLLRFPLVTHVTLFSLSKIPSAVDSLVNTEFLDPSVFPSLVSLTYACFEVDYTRIHVVPSGIAQQLTHFAVYDRYSVSQRFLLPELSTFSSLKSLVLRDPFSIDQLQSIPATLSTISILMPEASQIESLCDCRKWLEALTSAVNIKTIRFSSEFRNVDRLNRNERIEAVEELQKIQECTTRLGVHLEFIDTPDFRVERTPTVVQYLNELSTI